MADMRTGDLAYGREYWDTYDDGAGYGDGAVWEDTAHIVKELFCVDEEGRDVSNGTNLIDIGCANGYLVRHAQRRNIESFGLDISTYAIQHASKFVRGSVNVWDFAQDELGPYYGFRKFDIVTCLETLEHIVPATTDIALTNLRNLWKPEGGVGLWAICVEENEGWETDPTHVNVQPRRWWEDKLREHDIYVDKAKVEWVRTFSQFRNHEGVFVVSGFPDPAPEEDVVEL